MATFRILSRHVPQGTEEITQGLGQETRFIGQDSNLASPGCYLEMSSPKENSWVCWFHLYYTLAAEFCDKISFP